MCQVIDAYGGASITDALDALDVQLLRHVALIRSGGDRFAVQRSEAHDAAYEMDHAWCGNTGRS